MAYRMTKGDETVQQGLRRIAGEQIDRALGELDDDELDFATKVHQVRKRCKKLRGLIRLVRPAFDDYSAENRAFRDAARLISGVRDARTLIETYDALTKHFEDQIDRSAFAQIRARLTRDAKTVRKGPEARERMGAFRREMESARSRAAKWELGKEGFDAIGGGLGNTYKRARQQMLETWSARFDEAMHAWRKRVKYHWYHTRLLSDCMPGMMGPRARAADQLSDLLGDHHDMVVLEARLSKGSDEFGNASDLEAFRALIRERKSALEDTAFELGPLLLAERRKALVMRWRDYWEIWNDDEGEPSLTAIKG